MRLRLGNECGQAAVETVAMLPLLAIVALAVMQLLAACMAVEMADHAAEAGAVALVQDRDPRQAVRDSLPGWSRDRVTTSVSGRRVRVRLRPPAITSSVADLLTTTAHADAGPR